MDQINEYASQLESIPGYDEAVDWINDVLGSKYQTKDPYFIKDSKGQKKRRKLPDSLPQEQQKTWKKLQRKGWLYDYNFLGWFPINFEVGICPLLSLFPFIGQLIMYSMHLRLINIMSQQMNIPNSVQSKMYANVTFDILISLPPIIGSLFVWMNQCSTRNLALMHSLIVNNEIESMNIQREQQNMYAGHTF